MNTPLTSPSTVSVPAATPTIGAIIGSIVATAVGGHFHDPIALNAVSGAIVGFFTWLFHFTHSKLGTPE